MKKNRSKKDILWLLLIAVMAIGLLVTCCDGMINWFGYNRAIQYLWNIAYVILFIPFFSYCFVMRYM